jgi:octaprenyl-diphosphate synthase
MSLGLAFQVVDDILDYLGEPGRTGKMGGNDLIEGKMTLPLIHALAQADPEDHEFIRSVILQDQTMRRTHIDQIRQLIEKYNGFAYARSKAAHFIQTALNELNIFTAASTADDRTILVGLAEYVLTRKK